MKLERLLFIVSPEQQGDVEGLAKIVGCVMDCTVTEGDEDACIPDTLLCVASGANEALLKLARMVDILGATLYQVLFKVEHWYPDVSEALDEAHPQVGVDDLRDGTLMLCLLVNTRNQHMLNAMQWVSDYQP